MARHRDDHHKPAPAPKPQPQPAPAPVPLPSPPAPAPAPVPVPTPTPVPVLPGGLTYSSPVSIADSIGAVVENKSFAGNDPVNGTTAIWGQGVIGAALRNLDIGGSHYGIKIGSGRLSKGIVGSRIKVHNSVEPLFLANVSDSEFSDLDIQADRIVSTNQWHCIYLERDLHRLTFKNVKLAGGSGYCLQLYTTASNSDYLTFDGLVLDATKGRYPLVIQGFSHLIFRNATLIGGPMGGPLIRFYGDTDDVLFDGFEAVGGDELVTWQYGQPTNVRFRNGTYKGPRLSGKASAFTFEPTVQLLP